MALLGGAVVIYTRIPGVENAIHPYKHWWACLDSNQEPDRYERHDIDHVRCLLGRPINLLTERLSDLP
jgi:hypothetical protein